MTVTINPAARTRLAQTFWALAASVLLVASAGMTLSALDRMFPPPIERAEEVSTVVVDRNGKLLRAFTIADGRWRLPVSLEDVDPRFVDMLITYEDKRFYRHRGIDPLAMLRAAGQLATNGRIVSGGSTITMQLARLLEPRTGRTLGAKLRQAVRALQIERRLTKRRILELYLTLAPYGGNLEGVHAASLAYFGKETRKLTVAEAALLVALPQLPEVRRPDRNARAATTARNRVLKRMVDAGAILEFDAALARTHPVTAERHRLPAGAAHLAERLRAGSPERQLHRVTLDAPLQKRLEALARQRIGTFGQRSSMAILVADAASGEVRARVGSADYFDLSRAGAVDMTLAVRSPGSTLKPFIYGLAFEAGLARPASLIEDAPTDFNGYAPENFDRGFQGTVTVTRALQLSLNIPSVTLLEGVGPLRLLSTFNRAGVRADLPRGAPASLAIALGGIGMTLEGLVSLYTAFPNAGSAQSLHQELSHDDDPRRLLSTQSAWYVSSILAGTPPPEHTVSSGIAFKTGTSYGYRDAWAIGFDGKHVIGVWIGRPDGASVPGLSGRTAAAPILFESFRRLKPEPTPLPDAPAGVFLASTEDLPAGLRAVTLYASLAPGPGVTKPRPNISYPPDGARVELPSDAGDTPRPIIVKVRGGAAPFNWFADGTPISLQTRRPRIGWTPHGRGFSTLTVIDAEGRSDQVTVFLE